MASPKRICEPGLTYHTYSRCGNKEDRMKPKTMKKMMEEVLNMVLDKYKFNLVGYAIVDNHFHFFIETIEGEASISKIMQLIKSQYALKYNKRMNRCGPFWNERFGDTIINHGDDPKKLFFWIQWYIAYNSVRYYYVSDPRDYEFSSINCYLDENYKSPVKITLHKFFIESGNTFKERVKKFLEYEEIYRKNIFHESVFG